LTQLLRRAADGATDAKETLYELIYDDLREAARRVLKKNARGDFQTTALVNESLLRFEKEGVLKKFSENRRVFFSVAIRAMQQVLVNHCRRRKRENTQLDEEGNPFDQTISSIQERTGFDFEDLSTALNELENESPRQHAVITHRFFGGLTLKQTAEVLEVSEGTVERDWRLARAKLIRRLKD
jgi:RNA polymerase sigma factor (TIGR02999 family)